MAGKALGVSVTRANLNVTALLSSEAFSIGEQMALMAAVAFIQRSVKNPRSAKAKALRLVLVDLNVVIDGALAKIPE